jgi:hypothetical protein
MFRRSLVRCNQSFLMRQQARVGRVSDTAMFKCLSHANEANRLRDLSLMLGNGFVLRLGTRLSARNKRWKWGELAFLGRISPTRCSKPNGRPIYPGPFFGFQCESCPGARHVQQDVTDSHVWRLRCHFLAFSRPESAFERRDHDSHPRKSNGGRTPQSATMRCRQVGVNSTPYSTPSINMAGI